jgi:hypothetical protein
MGCCPPWSSCASQASLPATLHALVACTTPHPLITYSSHPLHTHLTHPSHTAPQDPRGPLLDGRRVGRKGEPMPLQHSLWGRAPPRAGRAAASRAAHTARGGPAGWRKGLAGVEAEPGAPPSCLLPQITRVIYQPPRPPTPLGCEDKHDLCEHWAEAGEVRRAPGLLGAAHSSCGCWALEARCPGHGWLGRAEALTPCSLLLLRFSTQCESNTGYMIGSKLAPGACIKSCYRCDLMPETTGGGSSGS